MYVHGDSGCSHYLLNNCVCTHDGRQAWQLAVENTQSYQFVYIMMIIKTIHLKRKHISWPPFLSLCGFCVLFSRIEDRAAWVFTVLWSLHVCLCWAPPDIWPISRTLAHLWTGCCWSQTNIAFTGPKQWFSFKALPSSASWNKYCSKSSPRDHPETVNSLLNLHDGLQALWSTVPRRIKLCDLLGANESTNQFTRD